MATATEHQQRLRHHLEDAVQALKDAQNALAGQPPGLPPGRRQPRRPRNRRPARQRQGP